MPVLNDPSHSCNKVLLSFLLFPASPPSISSREVAEPKHMRRKVCATTCEQADCQGRLDCAIAMSAACEGRGPGSHPGPLETSEQRVTSVAGIRCSSWSISLPPFPVKPFRGRSRGDRTRLPGFQLRALSSGSSDLPALRPRQPVLQIVCSAGAEGKPLQIGCPVPKDRSRQTEPQSTSTVLPGQVGGKGD
jgi:hypothetical protein